MKKTAEWYEIDNLIPDGAWYSHDDEWWFESPDSVFTLRWSRIGNHVNWWMDRKGSPWLSGDFFTSDESSFDYDTQAFDMVVRDYESKAWGLDDLVMSDPYRYSKRSTRLFGKGRQSSLDNRKEGFSTTFWDDFSIADSFGVDAIRDTFNRAFAEWKDDYFYLTDLVVVLNHKIWQHHDAGNEAYARLYDELWNKAQDYGYDTLEGDELEYFWSVLD